MEKTREFFHCAMAVGVSLVLRVATSLHPYSGRGKPPMYGDFEAQRHWMEITVNLPADRWYRNSTDNDLMYWGLDYPPLTAYHSFVCGIVAAFIDPVYVELFKSRGFESDSHKLFMRYTVLLSDILVYVPSIVYYFWVTRRFSGKIGFKSSVLLGLLYPGIILIDHGHFQYNCVSLGLAVFAVSFLVQKRYVLCTVLFCLALNFKQMELYHAFPFFFYLLSSCVPKPNQSALSSVFKLMGISLAVILTFLVVWFPFLFNYRDALQVVHRLFPIARGVFEDKVSNVWCALNVFYKLRDVCPSEMLRLCTLTTLVSILPSSIDLFVRPNVRKFVPSLINSSLAFFLFSFQVHEKTILLVAIPVLLYLPQAPIASFWFLTISVFSMFPLLVKDELAVAAFALTVFYAVTFKLIYERSYPFDLTAKLRALLKDLMEPSRSTLWVCNKHKATLKAILLKVSVMLSLIGAITLCLSSLIFKPPVRYPDLFPLLISVYSCVHFLGFFLYFNYVQLRIPQTFNDEDDVKVKVS